MISVAPAAGTSQKALFKVAGADLFDLGDFTQIVGKLRFKFFQIGVFGERFIKIPSGVLIAFAPHQTVPFRPVAAVDIDFVERPFDIFKFDFMP